MTHHNHRCTLCGNVRTVFELSQCCAGIAEDVCDSCCESAIELLSLRLVTQAMESRCSTTPKRLPVSFASVNANGVAIIQTKESGSVKSGGSK
jgi:hypothetical protein